jgi:hypothetical protein
MRQQERRVEKRLKKHCKHRGFRYPPRVYTGVCPGSLQAMAVGTPGVQTRRNAEGRLDNAEGTRQGPLQKCGTRRGLRGPDGRTTGILPGQCGLRHVSSGRNRLGVGRALPVCILRVPDCGPVAARPRGLLRCTNSPSHTQRCSQRVAVLPNSKAFVASLVSAPSMLALLLQ